MQHGNVPPWVLRIVRIVRPGIGCIRLGMVLEGEHLNDALPDCLTLKYLMDVYAFTVRSFRTVKLSNYVSELVYVVHPTASTKSPTLHIEPVTPAAIAGVQRSVL